MLLEDGDDAHGGRVRRGAVQDALREPFRIGDEDVPIDASIGIAIGRRRPRRPDGLLRDADLAMYVAKRNGKARLRAFAPEMHEQAIRRLEVASELRGAIDDGQLVLFYQPIVDVADRARSSAPRHSCAGTIPTAGSSPPATSSPSPRPPGSSSRSAAGSSTKPAARRVWQRAGLVDDTFYVSVNLSARHLRDPGVVDDVVDALEALGLPAGRPAHRGHRERPGRDSIPRRPCFTTQGPRRAPGHRRLRDRLLVARSTRHASRSTSSRSTSPSSTDYREPDGDAMVRGWSISATHSG